MPSRFLRVLAGGLLLAAAAGGCGVSNGHTEIGLRGPSASPGGSPSLTPTPAPSVAGSAAPAPSTPAEVRRVFPVGARASYGHTHHDYPATDIFAACGSPVRAAVSGIVLEVSRVDRFDPAQPAGEDKGGLSVSIAGDDGVRYYGSHLSSIAAGIDAGVRVTAGTQLGTVGHTGNASNVCHLHFGLSPICLRTGDWWVRRGVIYPWKYLDSWQAGGNLSPVDEVGTWQHEHGCPTAPTPGTR
ncbi:M23 family metallopeptidase [Planosporangium thailandense]|uniref:M23 family metallopeptidase n=1 Tax=Planosporangium thailandense TaxID=765197 RepID=UPI0030B80775